MLESLGATLVYAAMGIGLLVLGYYLVDLLTPGRLGELLVGSEGEHPSYGPAVVVSASMVANALVIFTALWTNVRDGLGQAVLWTMVFGVLGLALQALAFVLVDLVTPGRLGDVICAHDRLHPAALVAAAAQLSVAAIVVASIA